MSVDVSLIEIDLSRDELFDNFTIQTLKERYLLPGETSPQHAFARAAAAFADDPAHAQRLYDYVSNLWFMFATPLLSNGGSERGLPISCFLSATEDSREGIFSHWTETGWLSSVGGGVGGYWGDLRSAGEKTGRGSSSTGVIPFIATVDRLILSVSQGGCYIPGTRILTDRGWVDFRDLTVTDKVAQVNDDLTTSFVIPKEIVVEPFEGDLFHFYSNTGLMNLTVTPNHGMIQERRIVKDGIKSWPGTLTKIPAEDARYHRDNGHHTTAPFHDGKDDVVTDMEKLRIAFQADGTIIKVLGEVGKFTGCQPVGFHLAKERKITRLRELLDRMGLEYSENLQKAGTTNFYVKIPLDWGFQKNLNWMTPSSYTQNKMKNLLVEIEGWDTKRRKNTLIYFTTVAECADKVLELACLAGRRAHYSREERDETRQPMYSVYIQDGYGRLGGDNIYTDKIPYKGDVYCVEVETGKIIVEYEGTPAVCGNTRRGSYAAYLDVSHPEIEEFITMRKPTGGDANRKATNLHNAVNITDEFMEAVEKNTDFHLRSPKDNSIRKTLKARDLWRLLIETRMQTGEPYMVFIDTINRSLPEAQKKLGLTVKQSNLCVPGYTNLLTDVGYVPIAALEGKEVQAWNGEEFSTVTVKKTAEYAELLRVKFSDGDYVDCTPEHKFYVGEGENAIQYAACMLKPGDVLETSYLPSVEAGIPVHHDAETARALAYTAGWATFAGIEDRNRLTVNADLNTSQESTLLLLQPSVDSELHETGFLIRYEPKSIPSGYVPFHWDAGARSIWLQGAMDAVGEEVTHGEYKGWTAISSMDQDLIREMRLLALSLEMVVEVKLTQTTNVLLISGGWHNVKRRTVTNVSPLPYRADTFCATEPKRGRLTFNGYVTGNCTEITLPTGIDHNDKMRTAVCCLSSVNAEKFDEWRDHPHFLEDLFRMLDNALTVFIEKAPSALTNAVYSATQERSVGLGLLGFQAYLQARAIALESSEARDINVVMFNHLRQQADRISQKLGAERGEAPDMKGTGERFAHKLAIAPNASSSILCGGTSPSIEPHRANAYLHKTLSGSFPVKNKFLIEALVNLNLDTEETWRTIIANEGSVQHLDIPKEVKDVFKTATELDQMALVELAADRARFICQAQSLNLFFEHDADAKAITRAHYMAWKLGVKSLYYCRSTTPSRAENTNTKVERIDMGEASKPVEDEDCVSCQG